MLFEHRFLRSHFDFPPPRIKQPILAMLGKKRADALNLDYFP